MSKTIRRDTIKTFIKLQAHIKCSSCDTSEVVDTTGIIDATAILSKNGWKVACDADGCIIVCPDCVHDLEKHKTYE